MREECVDSIQVLLLDECDRLKKLQLGSEEYERCSKLICDLTKELNSMDKIKSEKEVELERIQNERKLKLEELALKKQEIQLEKKKSIKDLIGKVTFSGLSVGIPLLVAIGEPHGWFVKSNSWKVHKF